MIIMKQHPVSEKSPHLALERLLAECERQIVAIIGEEILRIFHPTGRDRQR